MEMGKVRVCCLKLDIHSFQFSNLVPIFVTEKTVANTLNLLEIGINKLLRKLTKEKEKEKKVAIY
jgi:hypothetical protein